MPVINGSLRDITGGSLSAFVAGLSFRLNQPNALVTGSAAGRIFPTKELQVTPDSTGDFTVNLQSTEQLFYDAWYEVGIVWNEGTGDKGKTLWDTGIKIRVPNNSPLNFGELLAAGIGPDAGGNQLLVWVDETPPKSPARGQWWFKPSTAVLYRWE